MAKSFKVIPHVLLRLRKNDVANTCVENVYKKDVAHRETISRCGDIVSCGRKRRKGESEK